MARIKIKNLPKEMKVSSEEMRKVFGGGMPSIPQVVIFHPPVAYTSKAVKISVPPSGTSWSSSVGDESGTTSGTVSSSIGDKLSTSAGL